MGPGTYDAANHFGSDSKPMSMGRKPEPKQSGHQPGPGDYDADISASKPRAATVDFGSSRERNVPVYESDLGPGYYNHNPEFGQDVKKMTIGEKRPEN
mgnify:CR=1 FL=1